MKINRELSSKFKRISALVLVSGIILGNGINVYAETSLEDIQKNYHSQKSSYMQMVDNPEIGIFDERFVDFCHNGVIKINDKEYLIDDLYIIYGQVDDRDIVYLQSYKEPQYDLLSNSEINPLYNRKKIMLLKYSDVFADYYQKHRDDIGDAINVDEEFIKYMVGFVGNNNTCLPETYYYKNDQYKKK